MCFDKLSGNISSQKSYKTDQAELKLKSLVKILRKMFRFNY